jgi:hypothetical protein
MSLSLSVHAVAFVLVPNFSDDGGTQFGQGGITLSLGASGGPAGNAVPASEPASASEVMSEEADVISADAQEAEVRDFAEPVEVLPVVQPDAVQAADASEVVEAAEVPEAAGLWRPQRLLSRRWPFRRKPSRSPMLWLRPCRGAARLSRSTTSALQGPLRRRPIKSNRR